MKLLDKAREFLDGFPMWALLLANIGLVAFVFFDLSFADPLPALDEIVSVALLAGTTVYIWQRLKGGPRTPGAREVRKRMKEIERLAESLAITAAQHDSPEVTAQVRRMSELLPRARDVAARLLALEVVLSRPEYREGGARAVALRLEKDIANASGDARAELEGALSDARAHLANLKAVRDKGAAMRASLERVRQLYRRAESQVLVGVLDRQATGGLVATVDELQKVLEELDRARDEVAGATAGGNAAFAKDVAGAEAIEKAKKAAAKQKLN